MAESLNFAISAQAETAARTLINVRGFQFHVDEPEGLGGTDQAPNPVEYLLGSFAGCLNVVAHLVAQEQGLDLGGLTLELSGKINPGRLLGEPDAPRAGYEQIDVQLITGNVLTPEQQTAFIQEVERRCPVNDNLSNATPISVSARPASEPVGA